MEPSHDIRRLIEIMAALRRPDGGCPWDAAQTFATIAPYTIEEAYEVADAVARGDLDDLKEELGDLLLQVVYHARMAEEQGAFNFGDVVEGIARKLIRRHPHVFGDATDLTPGQVEALWTRIKAEEKAERRAGRAGSEPPASVLDGIAQALPALTRAGKLSAQAAKVGFDWPGAAEVIAKIREEIDELEQALALGAAADIEDETGDLLFALANLARHVGVDPEAALRGTNAKFERRFRHIEASLRAEGRSPEGATLEEMEAHWVDAKRAEVGRG